MRSARFQSVAGTSMRIVRVELQTTFTFNAGQYTSIALPGGGAIPLSIASAPRDLPGLEFLYRSLPNDPLARQFDELITAGGDWLIDEAGGDVRVESSGERVLVLAGGTGVAQARSIARQFRGTGLTVRWVVESAGDPAVADIDGELAAMDDLDFALFEDADRSNNNRLLRWAADHLQTHNYDRILLSGSPAFVYAVEDKLIDCGLRLSLEADAFSYAPRPPRSD